MFDESPKNKVTLRQAINEALLQNAITKDEHALISQIVGRGDELRTSRSKTISGEAQYLWRNVAFQISQVRAHQCMPVMADFYFEWKGNTVSERADYARAKRKELDDLQDRVMKFYPKSQWYGVARWAKALGGY